jgi:hypothetical protein
LLRKWQRWGRESWAAALIAVFTGRASGVADGARGDTACADREPLADPRLSEERFRITLVVVAGLAAFELMRAARIGSGLVNEDTSLLWVAARDWARGRIYQPNFYGQSYGSTLEGLPIALLHTIRVPYWTATPLVLASLEWVGWVLLAYAAWRRGRRTMAVIAVALPVLLSAYHTFYATLVPSAPLPRLLAIAGVAVLIAGPTGTVALAGAALLLGVGLQFDPSAALLAVPASTWWALTSLRTRRQIWALAAGAAPALAFFVFGKVFYSRHPDYAFHPAPALRPSGATLNGSSHHLGAFFALYAPELWRSWLVPAVAVSSLILALVATRTLAYALPAILVAVLVLYAMATPKAAADLGVLLPRGRILLALPAASWFLALLTVEAGMWQTVTSRLVRRYALVGVLVLCAMSSVVRAVDYDGRLGSWRARAIALRADNGLTYGFESRATVLNGCRSDIAFARQHSIELIVYADRVSTYACAALASDIETITPSYERRTWLLYRELTHSRTSLLMANVGPDWCDLAAARATCSWAAGHATLRFPAQPALPLLASLGVSIRGFGHRCHPVTTFAVFCRGPQADLGRHPFGAPPAQSEAADRAIVAAYRDMLAPRSGAAPLSSVELGGRYDDVAIALRALPEPLPIPRVTQIRFLDAHEAQVDYRVGAKMLVGEAVATGRHWKVAAPSFCATVIDVFAEQHQLYGHCDTTRFI